MSRLLAAALLLATAVIGTVPAAAAPAPTPSPGSTSAGGAPAPNRTATFGIGPADAEKIDGRPYLTFLTAPGARLEDHVAVVNLADKPVTLEVYSVDAVTGSDGTFSYKARSAPRTDAGTWLTPDLPHGGSTLHLAARSTAIVPIEVTIPDDASPGDHAAGVIAALTSQVRNDSGERVNFEQRVAVRALFRVDGPLHPALTVEHLTAGYAGSMSPVGTGTVTVTYRVRNTGNVALGAHQKVVVSGLFGARRAPAVADVPALLPGGAIEESVTVPGVFPEGPMRARVTLYPLTLPGDVDPGLPTKISAATRFWAIPWALIVVLLLLIALVIGLLHWRRRRRNRPPAGRHSTTSSRPEGPRAARTEPDTAKQGVT